MADDIYFPVKSAYSQKDIENNFVNKINELTPGSTYHFSLVISKSWQKEDIPQRIPTMDDPAAVIGLYRKAASSAEILITAYLTPREVHPTDYVKIILSANHSTVLKKREFPSDYGVVGDYLCETEAEGTKSITRTVGIKDGNRIFVISCSVDSGKYNKETADEFFIAVATFKLLHPSQDRYAEKMKTYYFGEPKPVPIQFSFPASWLSETDPTPPPRGNAVFFLNKNKDKTLGHISFCSVPPNAFPTAQDFFKFYCSRLKQNGLGITEKLLKKEPSSAYEQAYTVFTSGKMHGAACEISCVVIIEKGAMVLVALVSPSEKTDMGAWAINRRAFNILLETLKVGEKKWAFKKAKA